MNTYNRVIEDIKLEFINHPQMDVENVFFGDPQNLSVLNLPMPYVIIQPIPYTSSQLSINYKFRIYLFDLTDEDMSNYQDIISDCEQILNDVSNKFQYNEYRYTLNYEYTLNPFSEKFDDFVSGLWTDWIFEVERNQLMSLCYEQRFPLKSLISYYNFDDNTEDQHNSNDAILTENITFQDGIIDKSIESSGNSYITLNNFGLTDDFSYSFWMYINSYNDGFIMDLSADISHKVSLNDDKILFVFRNIETESSEGTLLDVELEQWNHFVLTYNDSTKIYELYLNSYLVRKDNISIEVSKNAEPLNVLLNDNDFDNSADVRIDEFGIWSRKLDYSEIFKLYNNKKGLNYE